MHRMTFRQYQNDAIHDMVDNYQIGNNYIVLALSTGAGKTDVVRTGVYTLREQGVIDCATITAPQGHIEAGFIHRTVQTVVLDANTDLEHTIVIPKNFVRAARESKESGDSSREEISKFLVNGKGDTHVLACTHAALAAIDSITKKLVINLPDDCSRILLIPDEGHHWSSENILGQVLAEFIKRGGKLLFPTATPSRADGTFNNGNAALGIEPINLTYITRTMAQHMIEGHAPKRLKHAIVRYAIGYTPSDAQQMGNKMPPCEYLPELVEKMTVAWIKDGCPKAYFTIPSSSVERGLSPNEFYTALAAELQNQKYASVIYAILGRCPVILNATGTKAEDKKRFRHALRSERKLTYSTAKYDAIVGIMRVREGTDWPFASHNSVVNMPRALETIIQLAGRIMRKKSGDHPSRDLSKITWFVYDKFGKNLSKKHSRSVLAMAALMADYELASSFSFMFKVGGAIKVGKPGQGGEDNPDTTLAVKNVMNKLRAILSDEMKIAKNMSEVAIEWTNLLGADKEFQTIGTLAARLLGNVEVASIKDVQKLDALFTQAQNLPGLAEALARIIDEAMSVVPVPPNADHGFHRLFKYLMSS